MFRRLVGTILFLIPSLVLFDRAWRLASEERSGWGWFLAAGMVLSGIAVNVWDWGDSRLPGVPVVGNLSQRMTWSRVPRQEPVLALRAPLLHLGFCRCLIASCKLAYPSAARISPTVAA